MKPANDIEQFFKKAVIDTDPGMDRTVLNVVLMAHDKITDKSSAAAKPRIRRITMKSPITKAAAAAAIIALVVLGLFEFMSPSKSGVVWGEVAQKVQASSGLSLRIMETSSVSPDDSDYAIKYFCPTGSRSDAYKNGQITRSHCSNTETMTSTALFHSTKCYISRPCKKGSEGFLEQDENWTNPKYLVQQILAVEYKELGKKMVDGVLCEGLETSDPAVMGALVEMVDRLDVHMELWVDAQTQYPVRFEGKMAGEAEGQVMESECVIDQFQWDVELDPSLFELDIPPDYVSMRSM